MAPLGKDASRTSTVCKHFWLLHDLMLPFQVIDCRGSTPSTASHWTEPPTIFLSLHWIFPVSKQPSWSGKDPKHNTIVQVTLIWRVIPAFFGHTALAGAEGTLPGHWRWWCAGPQLKASDLSESHIICICFKAIYNLWQILFLSTVYSFKACHYSKTFGRYLLFIVDYVRY